jgi:RNA polymerase sigma-70 factor (ECF subfamily)
MSSCHAGEKATRRDATAPTSDSPNSWPGTTTRRFCGNARDVVQDVFAELWSRRSSLQLRGPIASYLAAAVANRARSVLRAELRRREREERWTAEKPAVSRPPDADIRQSAPPAAAVDSALAALPERQRVVFRLRVVEGLTSAEVRSAIGAVSVKAVEQV